MSENCIVRQESFRSGIRCNARSLSWGSGIFTLEAPFPYLLFAICSTIRNGLMHVGIGDGVGIALPRREPQQVPPTHMLSCHKTHPLNSINVTYFPDFPVAKCNPTWNVQCEAGGRGLSWYAPGDRGWRRHAPDHLDDKVDSDQ